jgi:hypothetical protein
MGRFYGGGPGHVTGQFVAYIKEGDGGVFGKDEENQAFPGLSER